ncbi:DUF4832 domain-containing protein [Nonomuraea sp. NPDC049129]|uniref:DUF4832 domain-containing protein n=1 Tax=unclassified Nonomuraea TaxID=2593643 RepID=UPI0033DC5B91
MTRRLGRVPLPAQRHPRLCLAGGTAAIDHVTLPSGMSAGTYALLLDLPDPQLSSRPEYSIRLANENVWEATNGFNSLLPPSTPGARPWTAPRRTCLNSAARPTAADHLTPIDISTSVPVHAVAPAGGLRAATLPIQSGPFR